MGCGRGGGDRAGELRGCRCRHLETYPEPEAEAEEKRKEERVQERMKGEIWRQIEDGIGDIFIFSTA